jgi:hypothetical protein
MDTHPGAAGRIAFRSVTRRHPLSKQANPTIRLAPKPWERVVASYRVLEVWILKLDDGAEKPLRSANTNWIRCVRRGRGGSPFLRRRDNGPQSSAESGFRRAGYCHLTGIEVARFMVSDAWKRLAEAAEPGKTYSRWVLGDYLRHEKRLDATYCPSGVLRLYRNDRASAE